MWVLFIEMIENRRMTLGSVMKEMTRNLPPQEPKEWDGLVNPPDQVKFTPGKAGGLSSVSPSKGPKLAPPKGGCLANPAPCSTNRG